MNTKPSTSDAFLITGEGVDAVAPGLWIVRGQGNTFVAEIDAGLVVIDSGPGGKVTRGMIDSLRTVSDRPVHAICFSHGHIGYNSGLPLWLEHARQRSDGLPGGLAGEDVGDALGDARPARPAPRRGDPRPQDAG